MFGLPLDTGDALYDVAAVAQNGKIRGLTPKIRAELRQFSAGFAAPSEFRGIPFGNELNFDCGLVFTVEFERDLLRPRRQGRGPRRSPRRFWCGRRNRMPAAPPPAGVYASAGSLTLGAYSVSRPPAPVNRPPTPVYGGAAVIANAGRIVARSRRSTSEGLECRRRLNVWAHCVGATVSLSLRDSVSRWPAPAPGKNLAMPDCRRIRSAGRRVGAAGSFAGDLGASGAGMAKRLEHSRAEKLVLGVSGGLDSTLALLVLARCCRRLDRPATDIVAVTMPGFGTTGRTRRNAVGLCEKLGVTLREIDITRSCLQHFEDIGHDQADLSVVFENAQARERTQILMDVANQCHGLVIGTGDLSELALGWCTYNGDQMAMYGVNSSIPKSVIPALLEFEAAGRPELAEYLLDVIATPVSPELLPAPETGDSEQKTEGILGAYELHDFFLYHHYTAGTEPEKLLELAETAFDGVYPR